MKRSFEKLKSINLSPSIVDLFSSLFERAGVRVVDTNEEFSCFHRQTHIEIQEHLEEHTLDYVIELSSVQIDQLIELFSSKENDEINRFRILSAIFSPSIEASVNPFHCLKQVTASSGLLSNNFLRRILRMENLLHVYLRSPVHGQDDIGHTLIFVRKEWLIFPGTHGDAGRVFWLTIDDALDFHKKVFQAIKTNSKVGWLQFARWYLRWRKKMCENPQSKKFSLQYPEINQ